MVCRRPLAESYLYFSDFNMTLWRHGEKVFWSARAWWCAVFLEWESPYLQCRQSSSLHLHCITCVLSALTSRRPLSVTEQLMTLCLWYYYSTPVGERSIVINPSVCLSMCLSVCLSVCLSASMSLEPLDRSARNFVCSSSVSDGVALRYVSK